MDADLDAIQSWGAGTVITLIEDFEFEMLGVQALGPSLVARGLHWHHLPIVDVSVPDDRFEPGWQSVGPAVRARIAAGERLVVHCSGGLGRAGTVAARLLVELGMDPETAISAVRSVRHGALETP